MLTVHSAKSRGFTLIELLIVISIIGILGITSFALYGNAQARGRDGRRRLELDAIAKALESNRNDTGYQPLATTQFQTGVIPQTDPSGNFYCIAAPTAAAPTAAWTTACPVGYSQVSATVPAANSLSWRVCTSGETVGIVCKVNAQ